MFVTGLEGTEGLEGGGLLGNLGLGRLDGLGAELVELLLALVESGGLDLPLSLELVDDVAVSPADLGGELAEVSEAAHGLQAEDAESRGDDDALDVVEGRGNTLIDFELGEREGTTGSLVGEHATDGLPEDLGGSPVVVGTTAGVGVAALVQVAQEDDWKDKNINDKER